MLGQWSRRLSRWWRKPGGEAENTWEPLAPIGEDAEAGGERAQLAERLMLLATLCRASYGGFSRAAQQATDSEQATWLATCARQRKALASELRGIVLVLAESDAISTPWQRWVAQVALEKSGAWGESWMARCIRGEENLLRLYEQLFLHHLPNGIQALLQRQYAQIAATLEGLRGQGAEAER